MQSNREIISLTQNDTKVFITPNNIDLTTDVASIQLLDEEHSKFVALRSDKRKKEFLLVRFLRNQFLPMKEIGYLESGAPYLKDSNFSISISHTTSYVALATSPQPRIGIDIEEIQEKIIRISPRFMHTNELTLHPIEDLALHYTKYWCGKEALYKWSGIEGLSFQNELSIYQDEAGEWFGKSSRISPNPINLKMINFSNHILCFTY